MWIYVTFKGRHDFKITENVKCNKKASTSSLCRFSWGTDQEPAGTRRHCLLPYKSFGVIQTKSQLMNGLSTKESVRTITAIDNKIDYMWDITWTYHLSVTLPVAYPGIFFGRGGSTNSIEDRGQRGRGSGGSSPLVRGSGGSCNLVQEISFHIVKFS